MRIKWISLGLAQDGDILPGDQQLDHSGCEKVLNLRDDGLSKSTGIRSLVIVK